MDVFFRALGNIVLLSAVMVLTSLLIEYFYGSRWKWAVVITLGLLMTLFVLRAEIVLQVLGALTDAYSYRQISLVLLGGVLSGMSITSACIFFRLLQDLFRKMIS
ncbi:MAG: hypothetical protein MZU91_04870 [Desulfosudis oleivorans]|nr:hypothetical protein [Desulfosudis oleivorans]